MIIYWHKGAVEGLKMRKCSSEMLDTVAQLQSHPLEKYYINSVHSVHSNWGNWGEIEFKVTFKCVVLIKSVEFLFLFLFFL